MSEQSTDGAANTAAGSRIGTLGTLVTQVRWLLAERAGFVALLPVLGLLAAASELVLLVSIVRSLLLLVDATSSDALDLGPFAVTLSARQLLAVAGLASLSSMVLRAADSVVVGRLAARAASIARLRLVDTYFAADWRAMERMRSGHLQQLLGQNVHAASTAVPILGTMSTAIVNLAVYGAFVAVTSPVVGLIFLALGLTVVALFTFLRRHSKSMASESQEAIRDVQLSASSLTALNRELQIFDVQRAARDQLRSLNNDARRALSRVRTMQRLVPSLFQQVVLLGVVGVILIAHELDLDPSSFGTAAILAVRSLSYLQQLNTSTQSYVEVAPFLAEIRAAVSSQVAQARVRGEVELGRVDSLELVDASFAFDDSAVVRGVDVRVERGQWVGVVGASGAGKTTLVMMFAGLLAPSSGKYLVNGRDSTGYTSGSWASTFSLLSQEPVLIRGTLADNVRFFRSSDDEKLRSASERAAILDEIEGLSAGWKTQVGDGQGSLSGGQRQRVALARALYGDPQVIILDEPTSALDIENERLIEESLAGLAPDTIVLVVSHRPSLLRRCERFIVMEEGRIIADGASDDLSIESYVGPSAS